MSHVDAVTALTNEQAFAELYYSKESDFPCQLLISHTDSCTPSIIVVRQLLTLAQDANHQGCCRRDTDLLEGKHCLISGFSNKVEYSHLMEMSTIVLGRLLMPWDCEISCGNTTLAIGRVPLTPPTQTTRIWSTSPRVVHSITCVRRYDIQVRSSYVHFSPTGRHDLPHPRIEQLYDVRGDQVV